MHTISRGLLLFFVSLVFIGLLFATLKMKMINKSKELTNKSLEQKALLTSTLYEENLTIHEINWTLRKGGVENIFVKNRDGINHSFFELDIYKKHVVYIDSEMCAICIDKELDNLEKLANSVGRENIIIIMSGFREAYIHNDIRYRGWKNLYCTKEELYTNGRVCNSVIYGFFESIANLDFITCMSKTNNRMFDLYLKQFQQYEKD